VAAAVAVTAVAVAAVVAADAVTIVAVADAARAVTNRLRCHFLNDLVQSKASRVSGTPFLFSVFSTIWPPTDRPCWAMTRAITGLQIFFDTVELLF
jgi:hypothetical protein